MKDTAWSLCKDKTLPCGVRIRRTVYRYGKKKQESYPADKFKHLPAHEIEALKNRLNASREAEEKLALERYQFDHSFINTKIIQSFETFLRGQANNETYIRNSMERLRTVVLEFFVLKNKLPDPKLWPKKAAQFGEHLLAAGQSASVIKQNVQLTNRFVEYLSTQYPGEVFPIKIKPVGKKKLQYMDATSDSTIRFKFIEQDAFKDVLRAVRKSIHPQVILSYKLGLRVAESMGVETVDLYQDSLHVKRQVVRLDDGRGRIEYGPLKSRQVRDIPYWFIKPAEIYELLNALKFYHPDSVSRWFSEDCKKAKLPFQFHDLRRTFASRACDEQIPIDKIRLAMGHYDIKTTMRYIQDTRKLSRKQWKPGDPGQN